MASPLRPQHFISRHNGVLTALIAVDELPPSIAIRGVPRVLSQSDTHGMTSLGMVNARGQFYIVDGLSHDPVHDGNSVHTCGNLDVVGFSSSVTRFGGDEEVRQTAPSTQLHGATPIWNATSHSPSWRSGNRNSRDLVKHVSKIILV